MPNLQSLELVPLAGSRRVDGIDKCQQIKD
jgi:hypothetical protein